jgi:toxin ParE1/3/4
MSKIRWTRSAVADVRRLRDYIAHDSQAYADRFVQKMFEGIGKAATFPYAGRRVPEADSDDIREILFRNYRIMYRVEAEGILILMVIHGARDVSRITPKPWEVE